MASAVFKFIAYRFYSVLWWVAVQWSSLSRHFLLLITCFFFPSGPSGSHLSCGHGNVRICNDGSLLCFSLLSKILPRVSLMFIFLWTVCWKLSPLFLVLKSVLIPCGYCNSWPHYRNSFCHGSWGCKSEITVTGSHLRGQEGCCDPGGPREWLPWLFYFPEAPVAAWPVAAYLPFCCPGSSGISLSLLMSPSPRV